MTALEPGETLELGTRVEGGPIISRDENCEDGFAIEGHGGELYRDEIRRLAESAGFEVGSDE
jgi:hypothetical protein